MASDKAGPRNLLYTPEVYEQEFELDTSTLDADGIRRLRSAAYKLSGERIQEALDKAVTHDGSAAWMKYIYYRVKVVIAANGKTVREVIGRRFTTTKGLSAKIREVDEEKEQVGWGD